MVGAASTFVTSAALILCWSAFAYAQAVSLVTPLPKECEGPGAARIASSPLPNTAAALKVHKKIRILAIGASPASVRGPVSGGYFAIIERFLKATFKGLDVEIVHRGVSGELASNAADRIKMEVALSAVNLVLWQLGTADALGHVPVEDFRSTVTQAIGWLKEHKIDVILVGLRYARSMRKDPHYQAIRTALKDVAREKEVLRIGRYASEETMERIRREQGVRMSEVGEIAVGYTCKAEYLARAIAAGLFVREPLPTAQSVDRSP